MIFKCNTCMTLWTDKTSTTKMNPNLAPKKTCNDCATYDWPIWNKGIEKARSWLGDPNKKKNDAKAKSTR